MSESKKIAIICPVWNGEKDLPDLFKNLDEITYDKRNLELIFVDNSSSDDSVNFIKNIFNDFSSDHWAKLILLENEENVGIPAAYNQCYKEISSDVYAVLRIETDIIMGQDVLENMLSLLITSDTIGAVGAFIDGKDKCGAIYHHKWFEKYDILYPEVPSRCDGVLGCCMLVRKNAIEKLEYFFDSNLFIGKDETDLCIRLSNIGYQIYYQPTAVVYHKSGKSTSQISPITRYYYVRNGIIMLKKHRANMVVFLSSLLYSFAYVVWWRLKGEKIPLKAFVDGLLFDVKKVQVPKIVSL